jgi:glycosyltransferase involved in cell wall biosynthesis
MIKNPNGLWFYSLDLKSDLIKSGIKVDLISPAFKTSLYLRLLAILRLYFQSVISKNLIIIVPTLSLRFYKNQLFILHDEWPFIQHNFIKRRVARFFFKVLSALYPFYGINNYLQVKYNLSGVIPNKPFEIDSEYSKKICADVLIIGTETKRKRLETALNFVERFYRSSNDIKTIVIIGGPMKLKSTLSSHKVIFLSNEDIKTVEPINYESFYLSASIDEGFNRGAWIAMNLGFNLVLSNIPSHIEFYGGCACFVDFEIAAGDITDVHLDFTRTKFNCIDKISKNLKTQRDSVLSSIFG